MLINDYIAQVTVEGFIAVLVAEEKKDLELHLKIQNTLIETVLKMLINREVYRCVLLRFFD